MAEDRACLWVLAGTNGAGKSSIGGAMLRESGGDYFNPDEIARALRGRDSSLDPAEANARAWALGLRLLDEAIDVRRDHFFETTLGGNTMASRLEQAVEVGLDVRIWYVGLASPELHMERVASRVRAGGHDIPEDAIRQRFDSSRRNLLRLLPQLAELKVFDNSAPGDPRNGDTPQPWLVLHWKDGRIMAPSNLKRTPDWAKPIVSQALKYAR